MNLCRNLIVSSRLFPGHDALVFQGNRLTYAELERLSARAAQALLDRGVDRGDRVGLLLGNVPAFAVWYFACLRIGAVAVAVNTRLAGEEMAFVLSDCEPRILAGTQPLLEILGEDAPDCVTETVKVSESGTFTGAGEALAEGWFLELEPDEPATILYTSGTTGFPKGATLSHRNVCATVHAFNHLCGMSPRDRLLLSVPLFHCYGQNAILNAGFNVGATVILQSRFDLNESVRLIRDHRVTKLFGVPATFQLMLESCAPENLASVDYCFSAAATLPTRVSESWLEKFGMPIYEGYGLTETAPFASYNHALRHAPGSIGMPVDLVEMKVVDTDTGADCPPGTPGEIAIRGPNVMLGYWNRPEETAAAVREGWFFSGDIGTMDEAGYFYLVDRLKDMIVVGGLKVYPSEVERVLLEHPSIAESAVVGAPDPVWGEKVVAFAVVREEAGLTAEEVRAHCQDHLAAYKVPAEVLYPTELPRNPAGKVLKTDLREEALRIASDAASASGQAVLPERPTEPGPLLDELRQAHPASRERLLTTLLQREIQGLTGSREVPPSDALLMDLGMDSLMIVTLSSRLQTQVGSALEVPSTLVFDHPTIGRLVTFLLTSLPIEGEPEPKAPPSPSDGEEPGPSVKDMSEEEALEALERELGDVRKP